MIATMPSGIPDHNAMLLVSFVLRTDPGSRDNDIELIRQSWLRQRPLMSEHINALCNDLQLGHLTFPDSLTRARRKAQELNTAFRGDLWDIRHKIAQNTNQLMFSFKIFESHEDEEDEPEKEEK